MDLEKSEVGSTGLASNRDGDSSSHSMTPDSLVRKAGAWNALQQLLEQRPHPSFGGVWVSSLSSEQQVSSLDKPQQGRWKQQGCSWEAQTIPKGELASSHRHPSPLSNAREYVAVVKTHRIMHKMRKIGRLAIKPSSCLSILSEARPLCQGTAAFRRGFFSKIRPLRWMHPVRPAPRSFATSFHDRHLYRRDPLCRGAGKTKPSQRSRAGRQVLN
jgi:hypothetical protein